MNQVRKLPIDSGCAVEFDMDILTHNIHGVRERLTLLRNPEKEYMDDEDFNLSGEFNVLELQQARFVSPR